MIRTMAERESLAAQVAERVKNATAEQKSAVTARTERHRSGLSIPQTSQNPPGDSPPAREGCLRIALCPTDPRVELDSTAWVAIER